MRQLAKAEYLLLFLAFYQGDWVIFLFAINNRRQCTRKLSMWALPICRMFLKSFQLHIVCRYQQKNLPWDASNSRNLKSTCILSTRLFFSIPSLHEDRTSWITDGIDPKIKLGFYHRTPTFCSAFRKTWRIGFRNIKKPTIAVHWKLKV